MCPCLKENQQCSGLHWEECCQKVKEGDRSLLVSSGEVTLGVLDPVLDSPIQGRYGSTGENPMKGHKDDE